MPILKSEPCLYPDDLLDRPKLGEEDERRWWAMYTISRREKELVRRLRGMGIEHYCPMVPTESRTPKGRVRTVYLPLFSNYVFVYGTGEDRYKSKKSNCISRDLEVVEGRRLTADLRRVRKLISLDKRVTIEKTIQPGMQVRFKSGPFRGREGVVVQRRGETRLMVVVDFLQQGCSIEANDFEFEKA